MRTASIDSLCSTRNRLFLQLRSILATAGLLVLQLITLPTQAQQQALFVYAGAPMNASDQAISNRLVQLGFVVTAVLDTASTTALATNKDIVIVSSTVSSGNVAAKFLNVPTPVLAWENGIFDDMLWTLNGATDHNTIGSQQTVTITNPTHPLATGLSGTVQLTSVARTFAYGLPNSNAVVIARSTDGNAQAVLFAYESGAVLINNLSNAPARRIGFFLDNDTAQSLTAEGFMLFDAAVEWGVSNNNAIAFAQQPANPTIGTEGGTATFSCIVTGAPPYYFQWRSNGVDIPGARTWRYTTPVLRTNDNGTLYSVVASNLFSNATSAGAVLTVNPDVTAPTLVSAKTLGNPNGLTVVFSEPVAGSTASNTANYAITNASGAVITVSSAVLDADTRTIRLTTSAPMPAGTIYTLVVSNIQDRAANPNTILPNPSSTTFLQVDGAITRKFFGGLSTSVNTMDQLTNNVKFINDTPDVVTYPSLFEGPINFADGYGTRFQGYVTAPTNGNYVFYICSDDPSELYLSTDANPANKHLIARETGWSNTREWTTSGGSSTLTAKRSDQYTGTTWPTTNIITLTAGARYYIEALHKEGGGGDNIAVAWRLPGAPALVNGASPIQGDFLSTFGTTPGPVFITSQPTNQTVVEQQPVTFGVGADGTPPYTFQWYSNGVAVAGATGQTYTIASTTTNHNGAVYSVTISNAFSSVTSSNATLAVNNDTTPPTIVSAQGSATFDRLRIVFSETVTATTATNPANYAVNGGLTVTNAALGADLKTVVLTTSLQTTGTAYTVTVNGVQDTAVAHNQIAANSQANFTGWVFSRGFLLYERYENIGGGQAVATLTNHVKFPNFPDVVSYVTSARTPQDVADNYGARLTGLIIPQTNGNHIFYVRGDDGVTLRVSTNEDPTNRVQVAARDSNANQPYQDSNPANTAVPLVAGQRYFVEALLKEGGGGDYLEFTWRQPGVATIPPTGAGGVIPGRFLGAYANPVGAGINITQQPQNVATHSNATFSVTASASTLLSTNQPIFYQWQKNGVDILAANATNYTATNLTQADNGAVYRAVLSIPGQTITSAGGTVTVTNTAPVAANDTLGAVQGTSAVVAAEKLVANDSDADGDPLSITGVSASSAQGGSVSLGGGSVTYTPATGFTGADIFTYTVSDGRGGTATGTVSVTVTDAGAQSQNQVGPVVFFFETRRVTFAGVPGRSYQIQAAASLTPPVTWVNLGSLQTPGWQGLIYFEDTTKPVPPQRFYRTVAQ